VHVERTRGECSAQCGGISVTDAPGSGALFVVRLPLRAPEGEPVRDVEATDAAEADSSMAGMLEQLAPLDAPPPAGPGAGTDRPRVLITEDNAELGRFLAECLEDEYRVQVAVDGQDALEQVLADAPDLLLTDVMMPRLSGDQLVAAIRQQPHLDRLPIVVLTAKADEALRNRLLRRGAQDYLSKPFSAEELRARVANLLSVKLARDVLQEELDTQQQDLAALARALTERSRSRASALAEAHLARDHARAASEAKSQFLQLVSHELRTPLQAMQLQLDLLGRQQSLDGSGRLSELVERFQRSHGRMRQLVDTLLNAVRAETSAIEMAPERFDPDAVVRELVEELRPRAIGKNLALDYAGEAATVYTDPQLFRIIASNLIDNALKYTDSGRVDVLLRKRADALELRVSDTGPGIAEAQQALLFEPFVQLSDVRNKHHSGVGLGLHLSRRIAHRLHGSLSVESEPGRGSTFLLRIPTEAPPDE
jgi:signal transduction histidine kinase